MNKGCVARPNDGRAFQKRNSRGKVVAECHHILIDWWDGCMGGKRLAPPEVMAFPCTSDGTADFGNELYVDRTDTPDFDAIAKQLNSTVAQESYYEED